MSHLEVFEPPWYLRNGHLQTLITGFYKPKRSLPGTIEHVVPIDPFGALLIHENRPPLDKWVQRQSAVFLLHGLGSSHRGTYMTHMAARFLELGWRVFRFDLPGAGDSFRYTLLPPHGACSDLIWRALQHLTETLQIQSWRAAGVSLGANILLKILATKREQIDSNATSQSICIQKAVAVAPPIDLAACCENMERGFNRIYGRYFLRSLRRQTKIRAEIWDAWRERLRVASFASIRRFDETVTAPLAGFEGADAYYAAGSSKEELPWIRTPTILLIDRHDPIVPRWIFEDVAWSTDTSLVETQHGGHVGYLHKDSYRRFERWADLWIVDELLRS